MRFVLALLSGFWGPGFPTDPRTGTADIGKRRSEEGERLNSKAHRTRTEGGGRSLPYDLQLALSSLIKRKLEH